MRPLPIALAATLTCAGCASAPSVRLEAGRALLVAEAAVDGTNHAAVVAAPHLSPAQAAKVKAAVDTANQAVGTAHALYATGDLAGATAALQTTFTNVAAIQSEAK